MPDGAGSPEILSTHQTPAAGKKGGKPQTEEEKQKEIEEKEAADRQNKKEFFDKKLAQKEVLEEANSQQRAKIEAFQKKAKEKAIENWSEDELKDAAEEMFDLRAELNGSGADEELENFVRDYAYYVADELYKKLEQTGQGDEALKFYREILKGTPEVPEPDSKIIEISQKGQKGRVTPQLAEAIWRQYYAKKGKSFNVLPFEERQAVNEAIKQGIVPEEEIELFSIKGAADTVGVENAWNDELKAEMEGMNAVLSALDGNDFQGQLNELQRSLRSIGSLRNIPDAEKVEGIRRVRERISVLQQQEQIRREEQQRREEAGRRRYGGEEEPDPYLKPEEAEGFDAASYAGVDRRVAEIAEAIGTAFVSDVGGRTNVTNSFLRDQMSRLSQRLPDLEGETQNQGYRLWRESNRLKESLGAQVATEAQRGRSGLYAELRLRESEKEWIIRRAINADPTEGSAGSEDWRLLEEEFNKRFARADVNSSDDWRDALGPGGSIEIDEFITTLTNAGENRTKLIDNRLLTDDEQNKVREAVRRLRQEAKLREYLHSLAYFINTNAGAEDIIKAASRFTGGEAQVAFKRRGVAQMFRIYENAMLEVVAKNGGYLPAKTMVNGADGKYGEVEQLVWDQAVRARDMGVLPKDMPDWEIRRAIALGRGMGIVTGRFFEIAAMHGLSKNIPLNSFWANGLVKNIAFFQQVARFDVGQKQNAILGYYLEGRKTKMPWSTDELKKFKAMNQQQIFDIMVNDHTDDRLIQMKNPFHIGSVFTQTGWRWKGDKVNLASATARLLQYDENNPLIGVGLLIEANRGELADSDKKKSQKAEEVIRKAIGVAEETTPLKFFNNLISLRQGVLRKHYKGQIKEEKDSPGQIIIEKDELKSDIAALALVQERLVSRRIKVYEEYLKSDELKAFNERLAREEVEEKDRPKPEAIERLNFPTGLEEQDFASLKTATRDTDEYHLQEKQVERVKLFVKHIQDEFKDSTRGKSHKEKLMSNLKDKGWKVPWVFGTDDISHEAFDYAAIEGDSFKRRWDADIGPVVQTAGMYGEFITNLTEFKSQEDIVKAMKKIHSTLSAHDAQVANDTMRYLVEGVGKFYKKDWVNRLPLGVGKITGFVGGDASYAQVAFGRGQMAWDELDMQAFLHTVHAAGIVKEEQLEELRKRLGTKSWSLLWAAGRSGIPLLFAALVYLFLNEQLEQLKKAA